MRVLHLKRAKWARLSSGGIPAEGVRVGSHNADRFGISKKVGGMQQGGQLQE